MGDKSGIEWTDATWNPTSGCSKVSPGCKFCYAERIFPRVYGKTRRFTDIQLHTSRLGQPLSWRKPKRVFVNSMSDLFHESIPDWFIDRVFAVMSIARQHTFQVLTKRPERMRDYCGSDETTGRIAAVVAELADGRGHVDLKWSDDGLRGFKMPNVWLGVSVENQEVADERIPVLLETPAAVRFLSCEPLLGPIGLEMIVDDCVIDMLGGQWAPDFEPPVPWARVGLDWIICGGESGPKARPMEVAWCESLLEQCRDAGVPMFFKQGSAANWPHFKSFESFPEALQVREFPA